MTKIYDVLRINGRFAVINLDTDGVHSSWDSLNVARNTARDLNRMGRVVMARDNSPDVSNALVVVADIEKESA